jgi:4-hydroxy-4-methyl-2-oxoglutarate aldolase
MTNMHGPRHVVVTSIERTPMDLVDQLAPVGTATVHEAIGRRGYVGPHIKPIQQGVKVAGTAVTVLSHPGDNAMVHAAIEQCQPGDILVVANTAPSTHGMFGDLLAASLMQRGVRGLVIDAGVRDTADLREMGFPVWTQHVSCEGTVKSSPGSVNVPIRFGEQVVFPGDVICADDDGVVVVARAEASWAIEKSLARLDNETATRAHLEAGEIGLDLYGMRDKLKAMGVQWGETLDSGND